MKKEQIEENLHFLKESFKASPLAIFLLGLDRTIVHCNKEALDLFGHECSAELEGTDGISLVVPEDRAKALANFTKIALTGESQKDVEYTFLNKSGKKVPAIVSAGLMRNPEGKPAYIIIIGRDIGVEKRVEERMAQMKLELDSLLDDSMQALSRAIEQRDPYTAGHQIRVTQLAVAIAKKLGWTASGLHLLRLASMLHDMGKISIPSEILAKPGPLSDIERRLIEEHPTTAYKILKDIGSGSRGAQIVYQHHERLDGSGYPRGLQGEEIVPGARILAIADVVEAMSSHRPYREALALETALEHIESNRGTLYDKAAVDACLKLFRGEGFSFDESGAQAEREKVAPHCPAHRNPLDRAEKSGF